MRKEIDESLKELIINCLRHHLEDHTITPDDITADTNLIDDLGFNSLMTIELIVGIEKKFDIFIDEEDLNIQLFIIFSNLKDCVEELLDSTIAFNG